MPERLSRGTQAPAPRCACACTGPPALRTLGAVIGPGERLRAPSAQVAGCNLLLTATRQPPGNSFQCSSPGGLDVASVEGYWLR